MLRAATSGSAAKLGFAAGHGRPRGQVAAIAAAGASASTFPPLATGEAYLRSQGASGTARKAPSGWSSGHPSRLLVRPAAAEERRGAIPPLLEPRTRTLFFLRPPRPQTVEFIQMARAGGRLVDVTNVTHPVTRGVTANPLFSFGFKGCYRCYSKARPIDICGSVRACASIPPSLPSNISNIDINVFRSMACALLSLLPRPAAPSNTVTMLRAPIFLLSWPNKIGGGYSASAGGGLHHGSDRGGDGEKFPASGARPVAAAQLGAAAGLGSPIGAVAGAAGAGALLGLVDLEAGAAVRAVPIWADFDLGARGSENGGFLRFFEGVAGHVGTIALERRGESIGNAALFRLRQLLSRLSHRAAWAASAMRGAAGLGTIAAGAKPPRGCFGQTGGWAPLRAARRSVAPKQTQFRPFGSASHLAGLTGAGERAQTSSVGMGSGVTARFSAGSPIGGTPAASGRGLRVGDKGTPVSRRTCVRGMRTLWGGGHRVNA